MWKNISRVADNYADRGVTWRDVLEELLLQTIFITILYSMALNSKSCFPFPLVVFCTMFHTRCFVGSSQRFCSSAFTNAQRRMFGISSRHTNSSLLNQATKMTLVSPKGCILSAAPLLAIGSVQKSTSNAECLTSTETSQAFLQSLIALLGDMSSMTWNTILSMLSVCYRRKLTHRESHCERVFC